MKSEHLGPHRIWRDLADERLEDYCAAYRAALTACTLQTPAPQIAHLQRSLRALEAEAAIRLEERLRARGFREETPGSPDRRGVS